MKQSIRSSLFAIAALGLLAPGPAQADAVADFYKGKTITGYPGGNDVLLAMERGNPEWAFYSIAIFMCFGIFSIMGSQRASSRKAAINGGGET